MKKVLVILVSLTLFTACENEPLEGDFAGVDNPNNGGGNNGGGNNGGGNGNSNDLTLSTYSFDVNTTVPLFGQVVVNTDFAFNSDNKVTSLDTESILFGASISGNGTLTRDSSGNIITIKSFDVTTQQNQTDITYSGSMITQIVYDDFLDDSEDYTYTYSTTGSEITRTVLNSDISTVYTFDASNRITKKESFDNGTSLQIENLTYDANGNCTTVITTGENPNNTTYGFDSFTNPLKDGFSDQYWLTLLNDDYDAEAGPIVVQFHSTNNWSSITTAQGTVSFLMQYNAVNRINSRNGNYDLGDGVTVTQSETFNYTN